MIYRFGRVGLLAALGLSLGACEVGSTGVDSSQTEVRLVQGSGPSASQSISAALLAGSGARMATVPASLNNVAAIEVAITGVRVVPTATDTLQRDSARWISLNLTAPATVNLLSLPTATAEGLTIARGDLPAGTYGNVQLLFSSATITFREPVTVGKTTYPANQKIELVIPSNRIFVPTAGFTVSGDTGAEVRLAFDGSTSVSGIRETGSGRIIMNPVLRSSTRSKRS